ncbi:transmembrane protease serine 11G-like isoform X3 [Mobula hypostoma]|uniref:transmembrane protease serine 11G-like isoform X3 n=1 Tax=Mobula hypostoma TaxID=723540 RepID=UPI002FC2AEC8
MHVCGATVISQYWLLSAAHCFPQKDGLNNKRVWKAVMGLTELERADTWTTTRKIERLVLHEKYANLKNDVAVLKVDQPIKFGDYIRPACLPQPGIFHIDKWTKCHVTGWGLMEHNGREAGTLQEAQVELIPLSTCQQSNWYGKYVDDRVICAGFAGGGIDACQGSFEDPELELHADFGSLRQWDLLSGFTSGRYLTCQGCGPRVRLVFGGLRSWGSGDGWIEDLMKDLQFISLSTQYQRF